VKGALLDGCWNSTPQSGFVPLPAAFIALADSFDPDGPHPAV
jgi:hypothetical protein